MGLINRLTFQNSYYIVGLMDKEDISLRQKLLLEAIKEDPDTNVSLMSELTGVAPATVRRDLIKLAELNYIEKSYGKLSIINPAERRIQDTRNLLQENHLSLIHATVNQIHSGNVILINNSPLNCQIVDELLINKKNATLVTNSLDIFDRTKDSLTINNILLAGIYNRESKTFSGTTTYSILSTLRADCFIMHPSGIDFEIGFLAEPTEDLPLLQNMLNVARKVILYVDESCIKKTSGLLVAGFNVVSTLVINRDVYEEYKQQLDVYDFQIVIAE